MSDREEENPFESPSEAAKRGKGDKSFANEWAVGTFFLYVVAVPLFLTDLATGFAATILATVVAIRAWIDLRRKYAAEVARSGEAWMSFGASILITGLAVVVSTLAFGIAVFTICNSQAIRWGYTFDYVMYGIIALSGAIGVSTLYLLGPASVDTLRKRRLARGNTETAKQEGASREGAGA